MSKLTLQNLLEYGISSYIIDCNYKYDLSKEIVKIKQNNLNEKTTLIKFDFIELNYFYKNPYEEMVFVYPINSINGWFQFINCFLIIFEKDYLNKNNYERENIINSYYEKLSNKNENIDNYNTFLKNNKYNLIVIKDNDICVYNNGYEIYLIIVFFEEECYPLYNLLTKYFKKNSYIVKLLIDKQNNKNDKDEYKELQTNDEYELSLTEQDEKKTIMNKFKKDIFIPHKNTSNTDTNIIKSNDSTDNKKKDLIKNAKLTLSVKQLQDIASDLNLSLVNGNLKNGNPKFKTKTELLEDIKNCKL
jgi:hypothetical protein